MIIKYLNDELSEEERYTLNQWIGESNRNRRVFENIVNHLNISQKDVEEAKKSTYLEIINSGRPFSAFKKQKQSGWNFLKYAAIITICSLAAVSIYFLRLDSPGKEGAEVSYDAVLIKETDRGQMLSIVLPDETMVKLNAGSRISYPEQFDGDVRMVELEGEAFFDVKRDEEKPFHIKTKELTVEVLGTSFCVRTYPSGKKPLVAVQSGEVLVREVRGGKSVSLKQDQYAFLEDDALVFKDINEDDLYFGWVDRKLVFDKEQLQSIFEKTSRWFNVDFDISREFVDPDEFTGAYNNPSLDKVMRSLSFSYGFNYEIEDDVVKIY